MARIFMRRFADSAALDEAVAAILKSHFERDIGFPYAVMLAGGTTPFGAYRLLAGGDCVPSASLRVFFSDERLVPLSSPASNCGKAQFLFSALGMAPEQIIGVQTGLDRDEAAARFDSDLKNFINGNGRITLGLLGLGADEHTASLFSESDLDRARGRYAVGAMSPDGVQRVSVTPGLLEKIELILFVVSGRAKRQVAERLAADQQAVLAGRAAAGAPFKQIWFAED